MLRLIYSVLIWLLKWKLKWSFALIQGIVEKCIVAAPLKMAECCESTNETVAYNTNGVSVSDGESRVSDLIYRVWFKCYLPFINRPCQTFDFNHVLSHSEY